jgi:hypothetical protein
MRTLFKSDFFLRFAGGFALGAVALIGMQPQAVQANLSNLIGTAAHIV